MPSSDRIFGRLRPDTARPPTGADVGTSGAGAAVHPAPSGSVLQGRRLGALPYPGDAGDAAKVATTSANGAAGRPLSLPGRDGYPGTAGDADPDGSTPALEAASLRELVRRAEARGYEGGLARGQAELRVAIQAAGALAAQIEAMAPSETTAVAQALAVISTAIARRIVDAELRTDPTVLVRSLEAAVATINGSPEAHVLVHPDQLGLLRYAWESTHGTAYLGKRWSFDADASLPAGGCVLRYEHGVVALGLEAQAEEIAAALADILPGLPGAREELEVDPE